MLAPVFSFALGVSLNKATTNTTASFLGSQALYVLVGNVFTLLVGFPLQVYVARMLGAENLGIFSLLDAAVSMTASLLSLGLAPSLIKFIPQCLVQEDYAGIRWQLRRGAVILSLLGLLSVIVAGLLVLLHAPVPYIEQHPSLILVMACLVPISLLAFFMQQGLQAFNNMRSITFATAFLQLAVKAILAVVLLQAGYGLLGYAVAIVAASFASFAFLLVSLRRITRTLPNGTNPQAQPLSQQAWRNYSLVMYSDSLLGIVFGYIDRFLLGFLNGATAVGVLMLVKQLYTYPGMFFHMLMAAGSPMFSTAHATNDFAQRQHIYHLIIDWVTRLSAPLSLFMLLFAEPLLALYGAEFAQEGALPLRILVAGQLFNLMMGPIGKMLMLSGFERVLVKIAVIEYLLTVIGYLLLIPRWGITGATVMIAFAVVLQNIVAFVIARWKLQLRWYDRRYWQWLLPMALTAGVGAFLRWYIPITGGALFIIGSLSAMYLTFIVVSLIQGLHEDDKTMLAHLARRIFQSK